MINHLDIIFWTATYVMIVLAGYTNLNVNDNKPSIPYAALVPNFGWELCAFQESGGMWAHVIWLGIDIMILTLNYKFIDKRSRKTICIVKTILITLLFYMLFKIPQGMLISSFVIDFTMSAAFLISFKSISPYFKIPIAVSKLIADVFAGYYYYQYSNVVLLLAILAFACNGIYLYMCIKEYIELGKKTYYNRTA